MSANSAHQADTKSEVNEPPRYDKDRTTEGGPMKPDELAKKCTSQTCGHDAVSGGTQETNNDNYGHRK